MGDATAQRSAVASFAIFFDGRDVNLPDSQYTEFQVRNGSRRTGYRTAYVFDAGGPYFVRVGPTEFTVNVTPYAPRKTVPVPRRTTEAQLAALMAEDTDLVWDDDAVVTLTKVLPIRFNNVRWINPRFTLRPPGHASAVFVDVVSPGFRVENLAVAGVLPWAWDKAHRGTCDMFHVRDAGSLVCRAVRGGSVSASTIDTFCHVSAHHAGVVVEGASLAGIREYALYQNGGDAGVSFFRCKVDAHGYEPFFRVNDRPTDAVRAANIYIGHCEMHRRADAAIGKDGITPRDCRRFSGDSNLLRRCQIRSGQDDQGMADGGSDPDDVLIVNNTLDAGYLDHKRGRGRSKRIHLIRNTFHAPFTKPPIMFNGTTDSVVADNVWVGGDAQWRPHKAHDNAGLTLRDNGNGTPVVDPNIEIRARIAAIEAQLAALATSLKGLQDQQLELTDQRADLQAQLV